MAKFTWGYERGRKSGAVGFVNAGLTLSDNAGLTLTELHVEYSSKTQVLPVITGVSLQVGAGSSVAIMGPSGSGKSTLLNCAAGLLPASSGTVRCQGVEVTSLTRKSLDFFRRKHFGYVYQEYNLIESLNALENVMLPTYFESKIPSSERAMAALNRVGLGEFARRRVTELSGGQRQRVAIARAIATPRAVVFADEPTGALDVTNSRQVVKELLGLTALGTAVMLVTHDPVVAAAADSTVFLDGGKFVHSMTSKDPFEIGSYVTELGLRGE